MSINKITYHTLLVLLLVINTSLLTPRSADACHHRLLLITTYFYFIYFITHGTLITKNKCSLALHSFRTRYLQIDGVSALPIAELASVFPRPCCIGCASSSFVSWSESSWAVIERDPASVEQWLRQTPTKPYSLPKNQSEEEEGRKDHLL